MSNEEQTKQTAETAKDLSEREVLLRAEAVRMKERLARMTDFASEPTPSVAPTSRTALWVLAFCIVLVLGVAFVSGLLPKLRRAEAVAAEAQAALTALPVVYVSPAVRAGEETVLRLPGSVQAIQEVPILARADGYLKQRKADIGDRVARDEIIGEIEAPELDSQVQQARANVEQAAAAVEQSAANLQQAKANEAIARVTAQRWANLVEKGAVARQENDVYQAQYAAQLASVKAAEQAASAARASHLAARSNLARLEEMQAYKQVRAPFAGVVTLRNVDVGTLISNGQTLLFRIAQTGVLRVYINVPQSDADIVRVGQDAELTVGAFAGRVFHGKVTRSADALDPATRTLLVEVQVPNPDGKLMPGMYAELKLVGKRTDPPLLIPGDTLVVRARGPMVAVVGKDGVLHYKLVKLGRDFGKQVEVVSGIEAGDLLVANPGDSAREGAKVRAVPLPDDEAPRKKG
jgi:RND family efflux transporter MFP subunit